MAIRDAKIGDAAGIAEVRVKTWRSAYHGIISGTILKGLSLEDDTQRWEHRLADPSVSDRWFTFVDEDDSGRIIGFCCGGRERSGVSPTDGEVYALYVLPEHQGGGIGKALMQAAARRLRADGFKSILIWVLAENPARKFYEKLGGVETRRQEIDIRGELHSEVGYVWESLDDLAGEIINCD